MTISSGNITDEIIQKYIEDQEGETVEIGQFEIRLIVEYSSVRSEVCMIQVALEEFMDELVLNRHLDKVLTLLS